MSTHTNTHTKIIIKEKEGISLNVGGKGDAGRIFWEGLEGKT